MPVANAFGTKVLEGEILVIGMDTNLGTFKKRMIFFKIVSTPERSFFSVVD